MSSSVKKRLRSVRFHFLTILLGLIMIYPLVWLLMSSFKSNRTMFQNTFSLWPTEWDILKNYQSGWSGVSGIPFGRFDWDGGLRRIFCYGSIRIRTDSVCWKKILVYLLHHYHVNSIAGYGCAAVHHF